MGVGPAAQPCYTILHALAYPASCSTMHRGWPVLKARGDLASNSSCTTAGAALLYVAVKQSEKQAL